MAALDSYFGKGSPTSNNLQNEMNYGPSYRPSIGLNVKRYTASYKSIKTKKNTNQLLKKHSETKKKQTYNF